MGYKWVENKLSEENILNLSNEDIITNGLSLFRKSMLYYFEEFDEITFHYNSAFSTLSRANDDCLSIIRISEFKNLFIRKYVLTYILIRLLSKESVLTQVHDTLSSNKSFIYDYMNMLKYDFSDLYYENSYLFDFIIYGENNSVYFVRFYPYISVNNEIETHLAKYGENAKCLRIGCELMNKDNVVPNDSTDSDKEYREQLINELKPNITACPIVKQECDFSNMSLDQFFETFLPHANYDFYINSVESVMNEIDLYIGIETYSKLAGNNVNKYQKMLLNNIAKIDFFVIDYVDKGNNIISFGAKDVVYNRFIRENYYKYLIGNNNFSVSFFSSEYLYSIHKKEEHFDYTSIICGYIKSIEQLISRIVDYELSKISDEKIYINAHYENSDESNKLKEDGIIIKNKVLFRPKYQKWFDNSISTKIEFLFRYYSHKFIMDKTYRYQLKNMLNNFKKEWHNSFFHQENLYSTTEMQRIRLNTILLLCYIVGGYDLDETFFSGS